MEIDFSADLPINFGVDDEENIQISTINPGLNTVVNGSRIFFSVRFLTKRPAQADRCPIA